MKALKQGALVLLFLFCSCMIALGQNDSLRVLDVEELTISATRIESSLQTVPLSTQKINVESMQSINQQSSLQENMQHAPGIMTLNASNFAQDLRIAIRGFGARSAFGIRGIKLIVDGIPETTPDGQSQVDNLPLGILDHIEIVRGSSGSLYGNAAGGVISLNTISEFDNNFVKFRSAVGAFQFQDYQLTSGLQNKNTHLLLHADHKSQNGYRAHSQYKQTILHSRFRHVFENQASLSLQASTCFSPYADDPGGLTWQDVKTDRRQANKANQSFQAGESIQHNKIGIQYQLPISLNLKWTFSSFYSTRKLEAILPFESSGFVNLDRKYGGASSNLEWNKKWKDIQLKSLYGMDFAFQQDNRMRSNNDLGTKGNEVFNQLEAFNNVAAFIHGQITCKTWTFITGLRYDINNMSVSDEFLSDGDDSGFLGLPALTGNIGLSKKLVDAKFVFMNFSTSFETPTLSELSSNPTGIAGFNNLKPQRARNFEIGTKGNIIKPWQYDLTLFHITLTDQLVPFENSTFPGRVFYRNAGKSHRNGVELFSSYQLNKYIQILTSYTYSNFQYDVYQASNDNYSGNQEPGIPKHMGSLGLLFQHSKWQAMLDAKYIGRMFLNDTNTDELDPSLILSTKWAYKFEIKKLKTKLFLGINNLTNTIYFDNVRINAFGARYYEPAASRHLFGGISIEF